MQDFGKYFITLSQLRRVNFRQQHFNIIFCYNVWNGATNPQVKSYLTTGSHFHSNSLITKSRCFLHVANEKGFRMSHLSSSKNTLCNEPSSWRPYFRIDFVYCWMFFVHKIHVIVCSKYENCMIWTKSFELESSQYHRHRVSVAFPKIARYYNFHNFPRNLHRP